MKHPRDIITSMRRAAHLSAYLTKWGQREAARLDLQAVGHMFGQEAYELESCLRSGAIVRRAGK